MLLLACAMLVLAGCDLAEKAASFMPTTSRQAGPAPAPPNPEPDAKELLRANADTLFTAHPTALAVSPPKPITGRGYSVCVKAVVAGPMDPAPQPITLFVIIERGNAERRGRSGATRSRREARYFGSTRARRAFFGTFGVRRSPPVARGRQRRAAPPRSALACAAVPPACGGGVGRG